MEDTDKLILAGNLSGGKWDKVLECLRRYYDINGIAPTITTCQGGHREPKILDCRNAVNNTQRGFSQDK